MTAKGPHVETAVLSGFHLPAAGPLLRDHVRAPGRRTEHYLLRYDRTTLFYDLVRLAGTGRLLMTAPPLSNLWPVLRDGLRDGGRPLHVHRRRHAKYEQILLPDARAPELLILGQTHPLTPRADIANLFRGLNCAVTLNKDNPPDWLRFWARHHCRLHGLQGVLVFDNGSTAYTPQALAHSLADVPGLAAVVVVSAPFPYGTTDPVVQGEVRPNYLQPALLNLARTDLLRHARAVLNVDIDELVLARRGRSVFDRAARSWSGVVRLPVSWAHPAQVPDGPVPQAAHTHRDVPKQSTPRKWCARPRRGLGALPWHVHHIGGELFKLIPEARDNEVVHCRATSTGWHPFKQRLGARPQTAIDPELVALWRADEAPS